MKIKRYTKKVFIYIFVVLYAITIIYPIYMMLITSIKTNKEIFSRPYNLPSTISFENYTNLFGRTRFPRYLFNSLYVVILSLLISLVFGCLAAFILAKYKFKARNLIYGYFMLGIMIPIRLGSINILRMMIKIGLYDSTNSIVIVMATFAFPFVILVLTDFIKAIPDEYMLSARIDGCSESRIFLHVIAPLVKPAVIAVTIINFVPIWNEFWFPLLLIRSDSMRTIPLATALLFGQFATNYGLVFAVLSTASVPVIVIYLLLSKHFVKGISAGGLKG